MKVEVAVLCSRPYKPTVSVDLKQHFNIRKTAGRCSVPWFTEHGEEIVCMHGSSLARFDHRHRGPIQYIDTFVLVTRLVSFCRPSAVKANIVTVL